MSLEDNRHQSPYSQMRRERKEIRVADFGESSGRRTYSVCHAHLSLHPIKPDVFWCTSCGVEYPIAKEQEPTSKRKTVRGKLDKGKSFAQSIRDQRKKKNQLVPDDMKDYDFGGTVTSWTELD